MGTNYYHRTAICECCNRYDERHIGKSSYGWSFSFRGYKPNEWSDDKTPIVDYVNWIRALESTGKIFDEYGTEISLQGFKQMIQAKIGQQNHTTYCRLHYPDHARDCWLDADGHSFQEGEFS